MTASVATWLLLLLLVCLINRQVEVFRSFGRRSLSDSTISVFGFNEQLEGVRCHEANDHSRGNGCALSCRFCLCTDHGFGNERYTVVQQ